MAAGTPWTQLKVWPRAAHGQGQLLLSTQLSGRALRVHLQKMGTLEGGGQERWGVSRGGLPQSLAWL